MASKEEPLFLAYALEQNGKKWLIYWKSAAETIGITDGEETIYELVIDRQDRKKFAGNVADSLLDRKWKTCFEGKYFQLSDNLNEAAELRYIRNTLSLPKIDENIREKLRDIIFLQQETILKLAESYKKEEQVINKNDKSPKKSSLHSVLEPGRRKRGLPTGLKFEE
uniref:Uncharacterized protein n=1 Tax=Acrobeloides nanus TaxID=290746 RepID=A0A914E5T4_9BILA